MLSRIGLTIVAAALVAGCGGGSPSSLPAGGSPSVRSARSSSVEKVLYSFTGGTDGGGPVGSITFDAAGNAYGATHFGGIDSCGGRVGGGCGVVFELTPNGSGWTESALYAFSDTSDGGFPNAGVMLDGSGNVYGTASTGGSTECSIGCGVVYELNKAGGWSESVLHTFTGSDGEFPNAALLRGANGLLYGTTWYGGSHGNGTVFSLSPHARRWAERVLYSFTGAADGSAPAGGVIADRSGDLYGTTYKYDGYNDGVAFELQRRPHGSWKDRVIYTFTNNGGGEDPYAGLIMPAKGRLFGTAIESGPNDGGVAFELILGKGHAWTEKVLHAFGGSGDGNAPYGGLVSDSSGNLFGTTVFGGAGNAGTVYELSPTSSGGWNEKVLYSFGGGDDGAYPSGTLTLDSSGNLYGTASNGGKSGKGVVFEVTR
jgi:uncharacterized repeat protein (TIGR03803 family)